MSMSVRRPGVVTFIGVVLYIQAFLNVVAAIVLFAFRDRINDFLAVHGGEQASGTFIGSAIGSLLAAVLLYLVGSGIMRGSRGWRTFVVVVEAINMAAALYIMIAHPHSAFVTQGWISLLVGFFVIWALYGHRESADYFEAQ